MKRLLLLLLLVTLFIPATSTAESIARPGDPRLTFIDLSLSVPLPIELGTTFRLSVTIVPTQNIWEDETVFLHIVPADNPERVLINADFAPPYSTTRWAVGEAIKLGPINMSAPQKLPPGKYKIQLGLFHRREDGVYVREKYTNTEIKDWIVGDVEFYQEKKPFARYPDLVISDFSSDSDLAKWQSRGVEIKRKGTTGVVNYIATDISGQTIPSAIIQDFFNYSDPQYSDWRKYDILSYNIVVDPQYTVMLQIKDKAGNRFQKNAVEEEAQGKVEVNLINVGKTVDLGRVGNLSFFTYKPSESFNITLDDIRLVDTGEVGFERAFIEFKGLTAPKQAKAGTSISLTAHFLLRQRFPRDESMFIHFYRKRDRAGYFIADKSPLVETTDWPVGKPIKEGPLNIYIPPESPPGAYNIDIGFFSIQITGPDPSYVKTLTDAAGVIHEVQPTKGGTDYVKEPYINPPAAGPWTVGEIEILPAGE